MTNVKTGVIVSVAVLGIVFGVYWKLSHSKRAYAKTIIRLNGSTGSLAALMTFDEEFLKSWARALQKGKQSFSVNGGEYNTTGGKKNK